ncbi:MAG: hypothetical protein BWK73_02760 [Thiothrix lacustris]|uniref:Uncharacterized protein n=1 Tax=Thiothrix lacustris TaxID=525917 RepID=A0A1Y1QZH4_9GAMM|nr:MAG: hypothetical protein BWK73_02760 [Thiothrix lacustris]
MRMSSPWREAFEAYFRAYVYGKEIIDQVSCFIDQSRDVAMQQAHEMIGIDCLVSDEIIRRMGSESSFSSQIFIDTYLIMRKLRMVNDY